MSLTASPAFAAEDDPYRISGNVQLDGQPLEGVRLVIDGPGGEQEVETDAEGQWRVGVPERGETYTVTLDEETLPDGSKHGLVWGVKDGDFDRIGYYGPCPPPGKPHRYFFKVYALDKLLGLSAGATKSALLKAMQGHILAQGELVGLYKR